MRQEVWTGLVVTAAVFTVCPLQAKSLGYAAGMQESRSVRDTFSSSLGPSSTSFSASVSPFVTAFPLTSQSPSSSTPLAASSSPTSPSLTSPSFSSPWSSLMSSSPSSTATYWTRPSSSAPSPSSFSSSTAVSSLPLSSSSWPSSLSPNLQSWSSSFSSLSSSSSPSPKPVTPSLTPPSLSSSFSSQTSPSPPSPMSSSISSISPSPTTVSFSSSSQTSSTSLPSRGSLNPSSPPLPTSPSFMIPPSRPLHFSLETQFSSSISLRFHLLSTSFQLLSSAFELLSLSFQLLSNAYLLPISPSKSTLTLVPTSRPQVTSSVSPLSAEGPNGFWGNGSLIGPELQCDDAAKSCLSIGRLLHKPSGKCYRLGDETPCGTGHSLVLDGEALRSGQLRAVCRRNDPCDGHIMAYDGQCYDAKHVRNVLCNASASVVPYPTGLYECACYSVDCAPERAPVRQVSAPGKCVLPDLNRPPIRNFRTSCSAEMANCSGLLFFEGGCYAPLTNASCPEGQWLVLDDRAGNLSATCVAMQPCDPGEQKLHADGLCHEEEEIRDKLCPGEKLYPLPYGDMECSMSSFYTFVREENGRGPNTGCPRNDKGECSPTVKPA